MKSLKTVIITAIFILLIPNLIFTQTCSCAGNTSFNPLDISVGSGNRWHIEISYKFHSIDQLVRGSNIIKNDINRKRYVRSLLTEVRFALTEKIILSSIFSFAEQFRQVGSTPENAESVTGAGDSMFFIQFSPSGNDKSNSFKVFAGGGIKVPTGRSDAIISVLAPEDMQPGTGSWDGVGWARFSFKPSPESKLELFGGLTYRINGTNDRSYSFGNDINSDLGLTYIFSEKDALSFRGHLRYAENDKRFGGNVPNTGGKWFYLVPGLMHKFSTNTGFRTYAEIPIYRKLNGADQFSSKLITVVSFFYEF